MNTYVMSDIHGCYDMFLQMLRKINFSEEDQLIIAGDYIDRGSQSYEMLRYLETEPENVLFIKGNHDAEFAQCIEIMISVMQTLNVDMSSLTGKDLLKIYELIKEKLQTEYFDHYGTLHQLLKDHDVSLEDLVAWKNLIDNMPFYFKTKINGRSHIIVHAGYVTDSAYGQIKDRFSEKESFYIYARDEAMRYSGLKETTVIAGHTPTIMKGTYYTGGKVYTYHDEKRDVWYYNIDCGAAYRSEKYPDAKLACIRLEDKEIFYV